MGVSHSSELLTVLERGSASLREARLPGELAAELECLAGQVDQPCVLAVVGRMKAGKSTFINALLGEDVARVGVTETTATINRFRYGIPADPARPVRCHWRGGRYEDVSRDFLDGLQGNDPEALRRAEGIDHLDPIWSWRFGEMFNHIDANPTWVPQPADPKKWAAVQSWRPRMKANQPMKIGPLISVLHAGRIRLDDGHTRLMAAHLETVFPPIILLYLGIPPVVP